ncbi:CPBP family intramembrane glutamic endopeptidase [Natronobiforma cellulositropha]|uniref:CPBP family intramembrane glutamic endopeptidase n=1 Tax=Natronobiforma cellulositropha TaxID=1679076 RepID=UPI0021D5B7D2|nr:CPBP family intramembrane glutamic endopeptidase [Natronobiforma cellulositropha]
MRTFWLIVGVSLPLLLPAYLAVVYTVCSWRSRLDPSLLETHFDWIYAPFILGLGGTYVLTTEQVQVGFELVYLLAVPAGAAIYGATTLVWRYYTKRPIRRGDQSFELLFPGLLAPFAEELLFREGLAPLVSSIGTAGYVVVSSLAFGLYHSYLGRHEIVFKTVFGVLLCFSYLQTGSVLVPALVHFGYNLAWILYVSDWST